MSNRPDIRHTIYRYKLSTDIETLITNFSKLHIYASRQVFREKWKEWLEINWEKIEIEKARLRKIGYKKNVEEKMYTAARYYFKNKQITNKEEEISKNNDLPKNTRGYIVLDKKLVELMEKYIMENYNREFKPSTSYTNFIEINKEAFDREVERLLAIDIEKLNTQEKCRDKIKKTYKNRCYVLEEKIGQKNKTKK